MAPSARRIALAAVAIALLSALLFTCTYVFTNGRAWAGAVLVVLGIVAFSLAAARAAAGDDRCSRDLHGDHGS